MNLFEILQEKDAFIVSPLDPDYEGPYPALIRKKGKLANRRTGEIYPLDPESGRQVARLKNGKKAGRYIASINGMPYGSYQYKVVERTSLYIKAKQKSLATDTQGLLGRPILVEQEVLITKGGISCGNYG